MPRPSTSSPAPRVRHGIANTSAIAWCAGSSAGATPSVKITWSATSRLLASRRSVGRYGPPPTITSAAPSIRDLIVRQRADQHVLALARHQPRQAHDYRPLTQPVACAQLRARTGVRPEPLGVDAGRQVLERGSGAERRREPVAGVAADVGDHVAVLADAAQRGARDRKHRPADLVPVSACHHPVRAGLPCAAGQQCQRRRRPEPDGVDVVRGDQLAHPRIDVRHGQHQRARDGAPLRKARCCRIVRPVSSVAHRPSACARPSRPGSSSAPPGTPGYRRDGAGSHW